MSNGSESIQSGRAERITVLGGLGFMGSHVCRALVNNGRQTIIFDRAAASRSLIADIEPQLKIVAGDVTRADDVLGAIAESDTVINLIHTTVPGSSMENPAYDVSSNVVAAVNWLRRLQETGVKRVIYISSGGTVYGRPLANPIDESHPTDPISSYGITKLTIEKYVALYASLFGIDYRILRPSNVYGVGQQLRYGQGLIGVMAERALLGQPLEVWGTGESERDYLYVDDLVSALLLILDYAGEFRVFNISSGEGKSVLDIIAILQRQLDISADIRYSPARKFDVPQNILNSNRMHQETGWQPRIDLETGIARTLEWLKSLLQHKTTER